MTRVAVVTPYCHEGAASLERNVRSVREQTHGCDHVVVADGHAHDWLDGAGVIHIRLPFHANDCGDTPRSVGIAWACSRDYDAIALLDADCQLLPRAVEVCLAAAAGQKVPLVIGRRRFARPDGTILGREDDPAERHIDTNCYFFTRAGFSVLLKWALIPAPFHLIDDRILRLAVLAAELPYARVEEATVVYETRWAGHYRDAGETPPLGAKTFGPLGSQMWADWASLDAAKREAYCAALGFELNGSQGDQVTARKLRPVSGARRPRAGGR